MAKRTADWRFTERTGRWRARFYGLSDDDRELINAALEKARAEAETENDSHALAMICLAYLAVPTRKLSWDEIMKDPVALRVYRHDLAQMPRHPTTEPCSCLPPSPADAVMLPFDPGCPVHGL